MTGIVGSVNWIIAKGDTKMLHKPIFRKSEKVIIMINLKKSLDVFLSFQYLNDLSKRLAVAQFSTIKQPYQYKWIR